MDNQGELTEALNRFSKKADELLSSGNRNTAKIEVNAGGTGVWIATTACCVMVAVGLFMGLWVVDLSRKVERLGDYLQAIYAQAPHLKPKETE
jgi:hypothetical protein